MHSLILGQSKSGKSVFCKQLAAVFKRCGVGVGVFDPLSYGKSGWDADFVTNNRREFLKRFFNTSGMVWIVDEARTGLQARDQVIFTQGRHWGHSVIMIGQRCTMLNKTMREQCGLVVAFLQGKEDAADLAADFGDEALKDTAGAARLHGLRSVRSYPEHSARGLLFSDSGAALVESTAEIILEDAEPANAELLQACGADVGRVSCAWLVAGRYIDPEDAW
jgi:hypothetical protein